MANILPKEEFNKLTKDEQKELMETWRETATNRDIYNAMGISSDRYYKMCRKLDVKPKTLHSMETDTPMTKEEEEVVTEVEVEQSNASSPLSLQLSIENTLNKEQVIELFDSIIGFLNNQGEYYIKIEVGR